MSDVATPTAAAAPPARRHAWGLPAGSVRAMLALAVLGLQWLVALYPLLINQKLDVADKHLPTILISLQILMILILVHYFTAHGKTIGRTVSTHSPLWLPGGTMRFVLAGGWIALGVLLFYKRADFDLPETDALKSLMILLVVVLMCYFAGLLVTAFVRMFWGDPPPAPYQDIEAWVAMLALLGLAIIVLIDVINRTVSPENQMSLDVTQAVVSGLIGLYFGARS